MKTAVSLPDSLFEAAEKTAQTLGIPRSQLYAKALEGFIQHHNSEGITAKLNDGYSHVDLSTFELLSNASLDSLRWLTSSASW